VVNFIRSLSQLEADLNKQSKRLAYIEDETEMIDLVRLILGRQGFTVLGANGGREGLDLVRKELPDLVLLDLMMPDMDGWDVYHQIRSEVQTRDIPVIVITAKAQDIDKILGLRVAKVEDYISKPFSPQELIERIEQVLSRDQRAAPPQS
jgi:two-component system response regulator VicR